MTNSPPQSPLALGLENARLLIIGEDRVNRRILAQALARDGFRHVLVVGGEDEAVAMARVAGPPDLILVDIAAGVGPAMCESLRAIRGWRDVPILACSAANRLDDRAAAFAAGATDHVSRPIDAVELIARARLHLRHRALLLDLSAYRRRAEDEMTLARRMQERLLPDPERSAGWLAEMGIEFDQLFLPSSDLGGDLWGCRRIDARRALIHMVDFSGHGVGAALNTFRLHAVVQGMDVGEDPAEFLAAVNRRLCGLLPLGQFATMIAVVIDAREEVCRYAAAGSTSPLHWNATDPTLRAGDGTGLPLGLSPSEVYTTRELPFGPGGRLLLYSDAAIEIPTADGVLDEAGFIELAARSRLEKPGVVQRLAVDLTALGPIEDDLTLVLLRRA